MDSKTVRQPNTEPTSLDDATMTAHLEKISRKSPKNEKMAWVRKQTKMREYVAAVNKLEDELLEKSAALQPHHDKIATLRKVMCHECVHPLEFLVHHGTHAECKFCNMDITIVG